MIVHPSAAVFYSEIFMGGRKYYSEGEMFCYDILSVCTHGERPDGRQLFREKFIIDPANCRLRDVGIMHGYDIFANVVVLAPPEKAREIYDETAAFINRDTHVSAGITHLPNEAGLLFKVLARETGLVKAVVRDFCSSVRKAVKGVPLPAEFPWR